MLPINLNQLYYFWVISRCGSISAARERLFLNQSTLSQQLQQLEKSMGRKLLLRSRRGVSLTEEGKVVFEYCERMFVQAEELSARLRNGMLAERGFLRLGFSRSLSRNRVLGVERAVKKEDRKIIVKISAGTQENLAEALRRRACDIVLSDTDFSSSLGPDYYSHLVASIPHYFVSTPALKNRGGRFPEMMNRLPLMVRTPENPLHREGVDYLHGNGVIPSIHAEVEDPDTILAMVLAGEGVGLLDLFITWKYLEKGRLVKLHERSIGIRENLWLIAGRRPYGDERVRGIIDYLMGGFRLDEDALFKWG